MSVIHCGIAGKINLRYQRQTQLSLCQMNLSSSQSSDLFLLYSTYQQGATLWTSSLGRHSSPGKLSGHLDKIVITPLVLGLHVVPYMGKQPGQLLLGHIHAMHRWSDSELASLATWTKGPGAPPKSLVYPLPKKGRLNKPSLQFGASLGVAMLCFSLFFQNFSKRKVDNKKERSDAGHTE